MSDFQVMPELDPATEAALRDSIRRFGVLVPVVRDQHGRTLDGHHRERIAGELGIPFPVDRVAVDDDDHAKQIATTLNADRRQLSIEQRREVVASLRAQGHSLRSIAKAVGTSLGAVQRDMAGVSADTPAPERTTGIDGKTYPAMRPIQRAAAPTAPQRTTTTDDDFAAAVEEFPELAPERSPGLPPAKVIEMAADLRRIPEGPERDSARRGAATYHKVHGNQDPRDAAANAPSQLGFKVLRHLRDAMTVMRAAGGPQAVMDDLDGEPIAAATRGLWATDLTAIKEVIDQWHALTTEPQRLRRVK